MHVEYPTPKVKELAAGWRQLGPEDVIAKGDYYWHTQQNKWVSLSLWAGEPLKCLSYFVNQTDNGRYVVRPGHEAIRKIQPAPGVVLTWD